MAEKKKKRNMSPNSLKNLEKGRGFSKNSTEIARKAQEKSVVARKENLDYRKLAAHIDNIPLAADIAEKFTEMGIDKKFHVRGTKKLLQLNKKAEEGDVKSIEMWMKIRGDLDEKTNINVNVGNSNSNEIVFGGDIFEEEQ